MLILADLSKILFMGTLGAGFLLFFLILCAVGFGALSRHQLYNRFRHVAPETGQVWTDGSTRYTLTVVGNKVHLEADGSALETVCRDASCPMHFTESVEAWYHRHHDNQLYLVIPR